MQDIEILKSIIEERKNNAIDLVKRRLDNMLPANLNQLHKEIEENGLAVVPDFITEQECQEIRDWMEQTITTNPKIWKDSKESDHRIFFANAASPKINEFYEDEMITSVLSTYEKTRTRVGFTLANKVVFKENNAGSGGGWHRDFVKRKQTKSLMYLCNVTDQTGPFQFLKTTHKFRNIVRYQREFGFKYNQFRFSDEEIQRVVEKYPELLFTATGGPGTLILVDTRGIHRGKPIEGGVRYALTNYYWFNGAIPAHIRKMNPFA